MCPTNNHYGADRWPRNYLILKLDDEPLLRTRKPVHYGFVVEDLRHPTGDAEGRVRLWQRLSLHGLRPGEQHLVRFCSCCPWRR